MPPISKKAIIVVGHTGLKVEGEGAWKVRQEDFGKRRTGRKGHIAINPHTHRVEAAMVMTNDYKDNEVLPDLLKQIEVPILQVCAEDAYDAHKCYRMLEDLGVQITMPPRRGAQIKKHGHSRLPPLQRNNLRALRKTSRKQWKRDFGYHKRSLTKTGIFRFKTLFREKLSSRHFDNQANEAFIKCRALNKISALGMPLSIAI